MATAKKLPSGSWRCLVYTHKDASGKRHYESFTADTKKKAEYLAAQYLITHQKTDKTGMTVDDAILAFIQSREPVLSPSTIKAYRSYHRNYYTTIKHISLDKLTDQDIQREINAQVRAGLSPKSVRNAHGLLSAVLAMYRPEYSIRTELPKKIRHEITLPTEDDMQRLLAAVKGTEMELPVMLAAFGPMRRGEICALRTDNINGNVVHVCEAIVETDDPEHRLKVKQPKSYAGDRYIEYPDFVARLWEGKEGRVVNLTPIAITRRFERILKSNGIPHFRFHDLRHYSASIQHALGIPDVYIMQRGGWSTDGTLKAVYRHAMEDRQKEMNDRANDYFKRFEA